MPRIALLAEDVASQVAAGEVVERPASVIKELVENSIDAQATRIEVLIRRGGISYMKIVDDGIGMDRDDALLCLERHATSKIRTGHDLAAIHTLGFRGEALPSIASVSRFRLTTREQHALVGTEVIVNGGKIENVRDRGDAPGSQIEVRQLFYNLPARRKFLRTENTEASHVEHQLHLQAIGHPEVGFVFLNEERLVYQLPPTPNLRDRIRDLCGPARTAELLEVPALASEDLQVRGFIGRAGVSRSTRQQQLVFLNGRAVENSTLHYAVREGYRTALMKGQYPVTFLFLEMNPAAVDVNVHPAKREVRFRDPAAVREVLVEAVRRTLESDRGAWSQTFHAAPAPAPGNAPQTPALIPEREQVALRRDWASLPVQTPASSEPRDAAPNIEQPTSPRPLPEPGPGKPAPLPSPAARDQASPGSDFRILGVLGKLYVLMENAHGLV
ncbi:MAG: DNA mismatch repair endonuclease MutL, partial [Verrucomicrobiota bacterium]|nr:DNA mismatch repair endonuclease MutL [Verrucomicrobiota bacterium]